MKVSQLHLHGSCAAESRDQLLRIPCYLSQPCTQSSHLADTNMMNHSES